MKKGEHMKIRLNAPAANQIEVDGVVFSNSASVDVFIVQLRKARNTVWPPEKKKEPAKDKK